MGREPIVPALGALIDDLGAADRWTPMLDWSAHGLAGELRGWTLFRPVQPDARELPYRDGTVDDLERMAEAARVAASAVVRVTTDEAGEAAVVETRRMRPELVTAPAPVLILMATDSGDDWLRRLTEAVAERPGVEVRAAAGALAAAVETDAPTVVVAERGVLPQPGCIEAAERLLALDGRVGGVAVKLLAADGSLEAAGGACFADGSVGGIARGAEAAAPWHEYVRPVDAAVGLVVLRSEAARQTALAADTGALDLTSISAGVWARGWELRYQPDAVALRVVPPAAAGESFWPESLNGRPERPAALGDDFWRRLLARGEVGAFG
jgi:hypothetical protein